MDLFIWAFWFVSSFLYKTNTLPNIVWISVEDMSPHLGAYGEKIAKTPYLDRLASKSIVYRNAFSTAGVCAPSRAAIISACHQWTFGAQHMRTLNPNNANSSQSYPPGHQSYSAMVPANIKLFPQILREHGYYCTNNEKQDYQFVAPVTLWNENSNKAHWRNRKSNQPFFSIFNLVITHESQVWMRAHEPLKVNPDDVIVPPYYPDTKNVRLDIARHLTNVMNMDSIVGTIISQLKADNLYDNTILFFWSDHGDGLPNVKREIYDRGIRVPLMVHIPKKYQSKAKSLQGDNKDLVSLLDLGPTVLSLAGIKPSDKYHGIPFLGKYKGETRKYIYSARDRMDSEYDMVRGIHDGTNTFYKNYFPEQPYYQNIKYRLSQSSMQEILKYKEEGKLNTIQSHWFTTKPKEEFYTIKIDPYELINLIDAPAHNSKINELRSELEKQLARYGDMGNMKEMEMVKMIWNGDEMPVTEAAAMIKLKNGYKIKNNAPELNLAYRIKNKNHISNSWQLYQGKAIIKNSGDTLVVRSHRIGYKPNEIVID